MTLYRRATKSDLPRVLDLLREIMEYHDIAPPRNEAHTACVATIIASRDHLFLLAEEDGAVIGMCALLFSMSTWSAAPVCEIQDVIVTRTHRGKGEGRGLLKAADELAVARGCTRVYLLAEYWNLDAHAFYRRVGLTEDTCLDFERDLRAQLP
jgi:N-acetylglutamate synthase-like GNAT family acetyltransferase